MRQPVTMRLDPKVVKAAKAKAAAHNRTLTNYVETLLMRDLALSDAPMGLEVIAPPGVRESVSVADPAEPEAERLRREAIFMAVLDASGH